MNERWRVVLLAVAIACAIAGAAFALRGHASSAAIADASSRAIAPKITRRCLRCGRSIPEGEALVVANDAHGRARLAFRGCVACLVEVLDDYARLTSSVLVPPERPGGKR